MNGSVHYYSTLPQLHTLLSRFAVGDLERGLAAAIMNLLPTISEEMRITQKLTENSANFCGCAGETYLISDNCKFAQFFTNLWHSLGFIIIRSKFSGQNG